MCCIASILCFYSLLLISLFIAWSYFIVFVLNVFVYVYVSVVWSLMLAVDDHVLYVFIVWSPWCAGMSCFYSIFYGQPVVYLYIAEMHQHSTIETKQTYISCENGLTKAESNI